MQNERFFRMWRFHKLQRVSFVSFCLECARFTHLIVDRCHADFCYFCGKKYYMRLDNKYLGPFHNLKYCTCSKNLLPDTPCSRRLLRATILCECGVCLWCEHVSANSIVDSHLCRFLLLLPSSSDRRRTLGGLGHSFDSGRGCRERTPDGHFTKL